MVLVEPRSTHVVSENLLPIRYHNQVRLHLVYQVQGREGTVGDGIEWSDSGS